VNKKFIQRYLTLPTMGLTRRAASYVITTLLENSDGKFSAYTYDNLFFEIPVFFEIVWILVSRDIFS